MPRVAEMEEVELTYLAMPDEWASSAHGVPSLQVHRQLVQVGVPEGRDELGEAAKVKVFRLHNRPQVRVKIVDVCPQIAKHMHARTSRG